MTGSHIYVNRDNLVKYYDRYVNMVYKICYTYVKNPSDTEDLVQETFIKLMNSEKPFENEEHIKSWLIVTSGNLCKNMLKHWSRKNQDIDTSNASTEMEHDETLDSIMNLPDKYKTVIYMYYYEGYSSAEIAKFLHKTESAVRTQLRRGRDLLKNVLGGDNNEE